VRVASSKPIPTHGDDSPLGRKLGAARFFSITYRLFKLREGRLESSQEDYGHVATYNGTIDGAEAAYSLDASHRFEKARWREDDVGRCAHGSIVERASLMMHAQRQ
jgi:hypothetical protein